MIHTFLTKRIDPAYGITEFSKWANSFGKNVKLLSGPYITPTNGTESIPDYFVTGSVVTKEEE